MCVCMRSRKDHLAVSIPVRRIRRMAGFTLVELLVVVLIVTLVSVVALPAVVSGVNHRQTSEAARILQGSIIGARDAAIHDNAPSGIRLLPDPAFPIMRLANGRIDTMAPLAWNRVIPIGVPPDYVEGMVSIYPHDPYPATITTGVPALILEESPGYWQAILPPPQSGPKYIFLPNSPASWAWNVRVGDRIQVNQAGPFYTVIGPMVSTSPDLFVNYGDPGAKPPLTRTLTAPDGSTSITVAVEYLLLVNGRDDNGNGWIDEGWDGVDNDGNGTIDDTAEWESETWSPILATANTANVAYSVERRPMPMINARETALPSNVVIDAARSRLTVNPYSGTVDIVLKPDGTVVGTTIFSSQSSIGLAGSFLHCWLSERSDVGIAPAGSWWLLTVFSRTGQIAVLDNPDPSNAFTLAQQGVR